MIIVDKALEAREREGRPVRVAMAGAGFMGRGIAFQIIRHVPGMRLVAISNRTVDKAVRAYREAGVDKTVRISDVAALEQAIASGEPAVTDDPLLLCRAEGIDAVIEVTGAVEYAAHIVLGAIRGGKHVILMNAELDGTVGPILKTHADRAGVVYTNVDGDQPGVIMNLFRFVRGIGLRPVLCGNIKGLHDPYRNPTTQKGYAERWRQKAEMVTSFADGTKISFEQTIVANATGMGIVRRGMLGPSVPPGTPLVQAVRLFPEEMIMKGPGIVDYIVGPEPNAGVFVLGAEDDPGQKHYLEYYKMGEGPLYCFYAHAHLCHFEVPNTVARAVLFHDAAVEPLGPPLVDVVATAKTDLEAGQVLDGIGCYMTYGQCEGVATAAEENLLPMGLAQGCRLKRAVRRDTVLTYDDVEVPGGRLSDRLRAEQNARFPQAGVPVL